jgi:hypothetical protein
MVFITAGMGGGTGTGGAPVVAQVAREMGILTVAVVTKPVPVRGQEAHAGRREGIEELQRARRLADHHPQREAAERAGRERFSLLDAFKAANDVLLGAVQGIADLITRPGMINVDFADVRTVMSEMGMAMMGTGCAPRREPRTRGAEAAIRSPLLEDINLQGARGILVNITAGPDLSLGEFDRGRRDRGGVRLWRGRRSTTWTSRLSCVARPTDAGSRQQHLRWTGSCGGALGSIDSLALSRSRWRQGDTFATMPPLWPLAGGTNRCAVSPSDRQHGVDIAIERAWPQGGELARADSRRETAQ